MKGCAALIGAAVGLLVSRHWLGALVGAIVGLLVGAGLFRPGGLIGRLRDDHEPMDAVFVLLGRLAKTDGRVDESEIASCERLMQRLGLNERGRRAAVASFQRGKQLETDLSPAFAVLRQSRRHAPLFLEIFIDMALADGRIDPEERRLLGKFAWMLGVRESTLEMLLTRRAGGGRGAGSTDGSDPYAVLGLDRQASDDEVRRCFRKLMSRHHPDKLAASGAAPEMVKLAQERTQEILAAYEKIKAARGLHG
jgi:DnaJ like chaperone protein